MVSHATILRGLDGPTSAPLIVKRTDEDFIEGLLRDARDAAIASTRANDRDSAGTLRLFQPVHRVYHLVVVEAVCEMPGQPRLDPDKIESAGAVIRRVASSQGSGAFGEAWMVSERGPVGWRKLGSADEGTLDPDPDRRRLPDQGNAAINARLQEVIRKQGVHAEDVITLYVAPDDVCAAAGKTLLFGLVPTASADTGDAAPIDAPYDDTEIANQLPRFLTAGKAASISEHANRRYTYEQAEAAARHPTHEFSAAASPPDDTPAPSDTTSLRSAKQMHGFLAMLKVLAIQLDAFGDSADAKKLREALSAITLPFANGVTMRADQFLASAADALVMSPGTQQSVVLPASWPEVPRRHADAIRAQFGKMLQARFTAFTPRATRFDDPNARFQIHPFIRIRREDGCEDELVWSRPSDRYQVAPWFDNSSTPPVLVRLPPLNRQNIKKLRPNVAFVVPKGLFNILNCNTPKKFIDGDGKECGNGGIDWICGFNIPIITLCAFIVLNIFLTLFNIIFFWLPFIKICFPLPAKLKELASPEL